MNKKTNVVSIAAIALGLWIPCASAGVIFQTGNHPQPGEENILFGAAETGTTISGTTNSTGVEVDFATQTGQTLVQNAQGQASITTADNGGLLTSMLISAPTLAFGDFIMNPQGGTGDATVTVQANDGIFAFTYALGNGQNFLTITTTGGEFIQSVSLAAPGGFDVFKQPRISGLCTPAETTCIPLGTVPEPASLALLGLALAGVGLSLRRRNS